MNNETENSELIKIIEKYEETLSWKKGGDLSDRVSHCLSQYKQIADNAIYEAKNFLEDAKTQYKALEMIVEGLTSDGMNHGQKRVIANHIITMLRTMVDRINNVHYEYNTQFLDRFDFFRSQTPEKKLYEHTRDLKRKTEAQERILKTLREVHPEIYKALDSETDIPY